ncbi:desampylase [Halogeometricum borinquense]|uniref:desampylase n=1 Tax=Halogeometricum borinquense TaxID=60847 RepID=UPI00344500A0
MTSKTNTPTNNLVLTVEAREAIIAHAREGAATTPPSEVCGVLGGYRADSAATNADDASATDSAESASADDIGTGSDTVTVAEPIPNVAEDPRTTYTLDPETTVETIDTLESRGLDVVGFYHSHPESDPVPSRTDERRATWTGYVYLICHPDGRLNAFRWTGAAFDVLNVITEG